MTAIHEAFPYLADFPPSVAGLGWSLNSDLSAIQPHELLKLVPALVSHLLANEHHRLASLLAGLGTLRDNPVGPSIQKNKSRNALSRAGVHTWRDLGELSPAALRRLPGIGPRTVEDILRCCVERAVFGERTPAQPSQHRAFARALETLQLLAAWSVRERKIARLGDLWQLTPSIGALPTDLQELWRDFGNLNPAEITTGSLIEASLEQLVGDLLESLDDTERTIYERRVLSISPTTLDEIGQECGFTRERARQLQVSAQDCIQSLLTSQHFRPLLWRAGELRSLLGCAAPRESGATFEVFTKCMRDVSSEARPMVERFLLWLAGPYRYRDGWLERADAPNLAAAALASDADQYRLLPLTAAFEWLSAQGVQPAFHDAWLERSGRFRRFGSTLVVWSGSIVDKSVAILALRGTPADAETLVAEVGEGHSVRTAQNGFLDDDRLVRVNRSEWALRSWHVEEYTGIADEIAQRITAAGGCARLADLVEDLVQQFGVKEGSVKAYAEAPMFVLEAGWVRLRGEAEPFTIPLDFASCRGVYNSGAEVISVSVPVDRETLRGSGRSFLAPVAAAMGVVPGRPRFFAWKGGDLAVTWPKTAVDGPSLGSTRGLALAAKTQEGDYLRLDFNLLSSQVGYERIPPSLQGIPPSEALRLLTGIDGGTDPVERLALALRVAPSDVRRRLIERGDSAVAELLPTPMLDHALESALSELAELLEKQG